MLCSSFVDEAAWRAAFGAGRADLATVARYLALPSCPAVSLWFDPLFYRATTTDLDAGADPLLDFLAVGCRAGRSPHPLVDPAHLLAQAPDAFDDPDRLAAALDDDRLTPGPYVDLAHLRDTLGEPPHRFRRLLAEALSPNGWLDLDHYREAYPDAPRDAYGALRHFIVLGDLEGRVAGPGFDGALYRRRYPDVAQSGIPPLRHWLVHGRAERRQPPADRAHRTTAVVTDPAPLSPGDPLPVTAESAAATERDVRERLARARVATREAFRPVPIPLLRPHDPITALRRLRFASAATPDVSVLIPVHDAFEETVACLMALSRHLPDRPTQIVVADDASPDRRMAMLGRLPGLAVLRSRERRGFLHTCNAAWSHCKAPLVLLLNSDTEVQEGAVAALAAALDDSTVAAACATLLYPSGHLQEAGGFVTPSGETVMVGLGGDPAQAAFSRARDVAYGSAAALMLRRDAVGDELFDPVYAPAYGEDVDLCLTLAEAGWRVRHVPEARVVHHLSVSTGRDGEARRVRAAARSQAVIARRWGSTLAGRDRVRTIVFHLPQFHPVPQNDLWWGAGFSEWANVVRARPAYLGHAQPHLPADLGFYDLRLPEALAAQGRLAARYGIEGFCVHHYRFDPDRTLLETPLSIVQDHPALPFRWCLCWANENWSRNWDGGSREVLIAQRQDRATQDAFLADAAAQAADPRYLRVDGAPILVIYRPLLLDDPAAFAARARRRFAPLGGAHLIAVEGMEAADSPADPTAFGFDAGCAFPPHGLGVPATGAARLTRPDWSGYRYDYVETVIEAATRPEPAWPRYPAVFPGWDNTPRQPTRSTCFDHATPEAFRVAVEAAIDTLNDRCLGDRRLLFVNAWNEWAEGAHLEPDSLHGHRWLEALQAAVTGRVWA